MYTLQLCICSPVHSHVYNCLSSGLSGILIFHFSRLNQIREQMKLLRGSRVTLRSGRQRLDDPSKRDGDEQERNQRKPEENLRGQEHLRIC